MVELKGKVALITGAGGPRSIGVGCARVMGRAGARIVAVAHSDEKASARAAELRDEGIEAIGLSVDLASEDQIVATLAAATEAMGRIDILVNNAAAGAAFAGDGSVTRLDVDAWDTSFAVNTRGTMLCCKHALPGMIERGGGAIVNISTQAARTGSHHSAYGASKAAVENLTLNIAFSYGKQGVRANCIAPGVIQSQDQPFPQPFVDAWLEQTLTPRLGLPEDIGAMAAFLASDAAGYVTGQIIAVDGGVLSHATWTGIKQW